MGEGRDTHNLFSRGGQWPLNVSNGPTSLQKTAREELVERQRREGVKQGGQGTIAAC